MSDSHRTPDKPILRELLWFVVLPYRMKQWRSRVTAQGKQQD